nr:NADH dehydrogenase subunit 1 [Linognathus africanus]
MYTLSQLFIMMLSILVAVGYFSLFERKVLSISQTRVGPNKVAVVGVTQPLSDALKLISKQVPSPHSSDKMIYLITPSILLASTMAVWIVPWNFSIMDSDKGILIVIMILSMSSFGPIMTGWAANSKFSIIGAMRAIAQTLSFEIIFSVSIMSFCLLELGFSAKALGKSLMTGLILPFSTIMLLISLLAESSRSPFDTPEGESELVGGYSVDYGGSLYKVIFLMENISAGFGGAVMSMVCFPPFSWWKWILFMTTLISIRASLPRIRYDQIMYTCWIQMIPLSIGFLSLPPLII